MIVWIGCIGGLSGDVSYLQIVNWRPVNQLPLYSLSK